MQREDIEYAISLRRYFHAHPELSTEEYQTQKKIIDELKSFGLNPKPIATTGVICTIKGKSDGKTILLRADTDALPIEEINECEYISQNKGVMHACGHDAHTASLLCAARILAREKDKLQGNVILVFQPGEEIGYGAREVLKELNCDKIDRCFGIHVKSGLEVGKIEVIEGATNASVDQFKIVIHGKGAHISTPHLGIDAALIASQIVTSAKTIPTQVSDPMTPALLGIGSIHAGTNYNIIAPVATIEGTLRCFSQEDRQNILTAFEKLVEANCEVAGATYEFINRDNTSPLINNALVAKEVQQSAIRTLGEENVITSGKPSFGGDDMAEFILKIPGVYAFVGSGNKNNPNTCVSHHNGHFDIDEDALRVATEIFVNYTRDFLK